MACTSLARDPPQMCALLLWGECLPMLRAEPHTQSGAAAVKLPGEPLNQSPFRHHVPLLAVPPVGMFIAATTDDAVAV